MESTKKQKQTQIFLDTTKTFGLDEFSTGLLKDDAEIIAAPLCQENCHCFQANLKLLQCGLSKKSSKANLKNNRSILLLCGNSRQKNY